MTQINKWLETFRNPVVLMSFGKDSMAMGYMIFKMLKLQLPVVYYRDPFDPCKNEWPDKIIRDWKLEVYDYPPSHVSVKLKGEFIELCPSYQISKSKDGFIDIPKAIMEPEYKGEDWHCGRRILERPKGTFDFPWDLMFIGHKSSDVDRFYGPVELKGALIEKPGIPALAFPVKDWTDGDIWEFIDDFDVPYQPNRYIDHKEISNKTFNNDYLTACTNCVDPRKGPRVYCPLVGHDIDSVADRVLRMPAKLPGYIK